MQKKRNIILTLVIGFLVYGGFLAQIIMPDRGYDSDERRSLEKMPTLSYQTITDGSFMEAFERYGSDQFPFRREFRALKAAVDQYGLQRLDKNGIYNRDGYLVKLEYPMNAHSVTRAAEHFQSIYQNYLMDTDTKVYLTIVPDKNYFFSQNGVYPAMDYEAIQAEICETNPDMTYIPLMDMLSIEAYYKTDPHWRQEAILEAADVLLTKMQAETLSDATVIETDCDFYGAYTGQYALPISPDLLSYVTSPAIEAAQVYIERSQTPTTIYALDKLTGRDPYEMYLSGSVSYIEIFNPLQKKERELVVFRDSFGSSMVPLLLESYSKITVIDTRYLSSAMLKSLITFENQDVLFLYSTLILNNSEQFR